ncbi:LuxR C-terminal-related transcriptional regulator [Endobacterium cereale]|uniref:LuxR C-terminal-related transcriptional regulator n=1 Tax=Endobacterium cereale TaxID=2663029 RepID=UPI002B4AAA5A|nr:LuxR C-terminal-related transcriptional regulator [Endobacterium cereale]MEB2845963.1 LuxR C-terminal-related transcriptional regulator [Endobacterium cereale]
MVSLKKDQRVTLVLSEEFLNRVDDWAHAHRIKSRGEAIRQLLEAGMTIPTIASAVAETYRPGIDDASFDANVDHLRTLTREHFGNISLFDSNVRQFLGQENRAASREIYAEQDFDVIMSLMDKFFNSKTAPTNVLTQREHEIVGMICQGATDEDIARDMNISPITVRAYVRSILNKMDLTSRDLIADAAIFGGPYRVE